MIDYLLNRHNMCLMLTGDVMQDNSNTEHFH